MYKIAVIGLLTLDTNIVRGKSIKRVGGPPYYISKIFKNLDVSTIIVSRVGEDFPSNYIEDICSENVECIIDRVKHRNIHFKNIYVDNERVQYVDGGGYEIDSSFIEVLPSKLDYMIISPVFNEINVNILPKLTEKYNVAMDPQGLVRSVSKDGMIVYKRVKLDLFKGIYIMKPSIEEFKILVSSIEEFNYLRRIVKDFITITNGVEGAYLILDNYYYVPAYKIYNIDTTGAGDMYLASLVYGILKYSDPIYASSYASSLTSLMLKSDVLDRGELYIRLNKIYNQIHPIDLNKIEYLLRRSNTLL